MPRQDSAHEQTRQTPAPRFSATLFLLAALAAAAPLSTLAAPARQKKPSPPVRQEPAERVVKEKLGVVSSEVLLRIMRAEDERRWEAADLGALLSDRIPAVRLRAALAAGRIGDEGAIAPLSSLLMRDASESVRAMAAFALGETESEKAAESLLSALRASKSGEVRARSIEALGKIAGALPQAMQARKTELGAVILQTLLDEQKSARPDRGVVLMGLTAALRARPADAGKTLALFLSSTDARVRADAANALARLRAKDAGEQLRALLANDADAVVRANAARALGAAEDAAAFETLLSRAQADADERVRVSALRALAALKDARAGAPLVERGKTLLVAYREAKAKGATHPAQTNEMLEIATTIGRTLGSTGDERALAWLREFREAEDFGAPETEIAFARLSPTLYVREKPYNDLSGRVFAPMGGRIVPLRWQSVASLAQGLGEIAAITSERGGNSAIGLIAEAQMLLRRLLNDANTPTLAVPEVMRALAAFKPLDAAEVMRAKLSATDPIVRATAAELLGELPPDAENTRALAEALPQALQDTTMNDAALAILDALAKQKSEAAIAAIKTAVAVPDYLVRRRAAALLKEAGAAEPSAQPQTVASRNKPADYLRALARVGRRVQAVVSTEKGRFVIEFLPSEAPLTVDNFVQLANRKYFDGVTFHRVVPNFVVQGGDPRGDGNGGPGYAIRCEINEAPYTRGAVGMALSGKDTGGSQWFVTHSPQPHLDGGYTVFGRVVSGMDVVDRISRGDRINSIQIVEGAAPTRAAAAAVRPR